MNNRVNAFAPLVVLLLVAGCGASAARSVLPSQAPLVVEYDGASCSVSRGAVISSLATQIRTLSSVKVGQREKQDPSGISTGKGQMFIEGMEIEPVNDGVRVTYLSGRRSLDTNVKSITKSVGVFKVKFATVGGKSTISVSVPEALEHEFAKSKYMMNIDPLLDDEEAAEEFAQIKQSLKINAC